MSLKRGESKFIVSFGTIFDVPSTCLHARNSYMYISVDDLAQGPHLSFEVQSLWNVEKQHLSFAGFPAFAIKTRVGPAGAIGRTTLCLRLHVPTFGPP